jgi:hypothetical protein
MAATRFMDHWQLVLRDGQSDKMLAWLSRNEGRLAETTPAGLQWIGLYGTVFGGHDWGWHLFIGLDSYAGMDQMAAAAGDPESEFAKLLTELFSFFDMSDDSPGGRWLHRAAPDIVDWGSR